VIFPGGGVQLAEVDADSPSRLYSSWDQLSFLVLHDRYSSSLGHDMNEAHPFTVRDWVDDASIQQLDYFSSDNFLHGRVEPSLWLPRWFGVFLQMYLVHNHRGPDSLNIFYGPAYSFFVLSQNV
jgi:hypothetical protein